MALYLVLLSTLGAIRGVHVREFVKGETVDLEDDDLAAVGCRDGWLTPVDDLSGAPAAPLLRDYTVLLPDELPLPRSGWEADRPQVGDTIGLTDEEALPFLEVGAIQLTIDNGQLTTEDALRAGILTTDGTDGTDGNPPPAPRKRRAVKAGTTDGGVADGIA